MSLPHYDRGQETIAFDGRWVVCAAWWVFALVKARVVCRLRTERHASTFITLPGGHLHGTPYPRVGHDGHMGIGVVACTKEVLASERAQKRMPELQLRRPTKARRVSDSDAAEQVGEAEDDEEDEEDRAEAEDDEDDADDEAEAEADDEADDEAVDEDVDEDEEDTACEVCGRRDGAQSMLLCDGCDHGWHMRCIDPHMKLPRGDWFCKTCAEQTAEPAEDRSARKLRYMLSYFNRQKLPRKASAGWKVTRTGVRGNGGVYRYSHHATVYKSKKEAIDATMAKY